MFLFCLIIENEKKLKQREQNTDNQLIEKVLSGDINLYGDIIKRYRKQVANTVFSIVKNSELAEDIGQEVFIKMYDSLSKFKGESKLGTYITRIAINLSLNALKAKKEKLTIDKDIEADFYNEFSYNNEKSNDEIEIVKYALSSLDTAQRTIITLRMIDGYSTKETSEILNIPEGTVLSRLSRAMDKLKNVVLKLGI